MSGYVRIHRSLIGHPAFRHDAEAMAFAWMVARAAWQPVRVRYKGRAISLERGQLAISVRDFAAAHDRHPNWVSRVLNTMRREDMIRTDAGTGVLVVTICNYDKYQADAGSSGTAQGTDLGTPAGTLLGTEAGHLGDTEQEEKNLKKERDYAFEGEVVRLTRRDFDKWQRSFPDVDLLARLQQRDDWLASPDGAAARPRWFMSTSNWLAKLQQQAKSEGHSSGGQSLVDVILREQGRK